MKFAEKIKTLRQKQGLTQKEVAQAVGITSRTYGSYEQEGRYPRDRDIYTRLAEILGCETNYLLTEDEEFVAEAAAQYGKRGKRQAEELVAELSGMFAGGELSEQDMDGVMLALQRAYFDCKKDNQKHTPKKYRKD